MKPLEYIFYDYELMKLGCARLLFFFFLGFFKTYLLVACAILFCYALLFSGNSGNIFSLLIAYIVLAGPGSATCLAMIRFCKWRQLVEHFSMNFRLLITLEKRKP